MTQKKYYPQKRNQNYPSKENIVNPMFNKHKPRYQKGHQNQVVNASRRTETYTKDKTVIVTEKFNIVDFNNDEFEYQFGGKNLKKNNRRKY